MVRLIWRDLDALDPIFDDGPTRHKPPTHPASKPSTQTSPDAKPGAKDESKEADEPKGRNPPTTDETTKG